MSNKYKKSIELFDNIVKSFKNLPNEKLIIAESIPLNKYIDDTKRKRAAVLIPLCLRHDELSFIFTMRSTEVGTHKGQVSFPGGHIEKNETEIEAAVRETNEELGSGIGNIKIIGLCQTIPAITGTLVTPVLGFIENDILDLQNLSPNKSEVSKVFTRSIDDLLKPNFRYEETLNRNGIYANMPAFGTGDEKIWGLTAIILDSVLKNLVKTNY